MSLYCEGFSNGYSACFIENSTVDLRLLLYKILEKDRYYKKYGCEPSAWIYEQPESKLVLYWILYMVRAVDYKSNLILKQYNLLYLI